MDDGVYAAMWTQQQTKLAEEEEERQAKMSEADTADSAVTADAADTHRHTH